MAKENNAKKCQKRLAWWICTTYHPTIIYDYLPKVKTGKT